MPNLLGHDQCPPFPKQIPRPRVTKRDRNPCPSGSAKSCAISQVEALKGGGERKKESDRETARMHARAHSTQPSHHPSVLFNNAGVVKELEHLSLAQKASSVSIFRADCIPEVPDSGEDTFLTWLAIEKQPFVDNRVRNSPGLLGEFTGGQEKTALQADTRLVMLPCSTQGVYLFV